MLAMLAMISFKPLQNGAVLRRKSVRQKAARKSIVSNPFKTGRYCVAYAPKGGKK